MRDVSAMAASTTVFVGDVHGMNFKLTRLFANLERKLGRDRFNSARVVFLGDLCDRGPDTSKALSFIVDLPSRYPQMKVHVLAGNHDLAFATFLGLLPITGGDVPDGWTNDRRAEPPLWQDNNGGDVHVGMHLQGRRWGGSGVGKENAFESEATFISYGVEPGDRDGLLAALPDSHKSLLSSMQFVVELDGVMDEHNPEVDRIVAVHAGLESNVPLDDQLLALRSRTIDRAWLEPLQGRANVLETPPESACNVLIVSGHHGMIKLDSNRIILDGCAGHHDRPLTAVVFPERQLVVDNDK